MLEELRRRNFADTTIRSYLHTPAPAAKRIRAHAQLRISGKPATRHPPAALLPTAPRLTKKK
jgi:hypothetical protein